MSDSRSSSNDGRQKRAIAFGQQVKQAVPSDHLNNSIPCGEGTFHNPLCDFRFKKVPVTAIYSQAQEPQLGQPPDLSLKAKLQSPRDSNQSEIKIVKVWSMAVEKDSNFVDNSHQHSNLMEQVSQIIPVDNSSNIGVSQTVQTQKNLVHSETVAIRTCMEGKAHTNQYVSNSSEKTTDNKATRLERQRTCKKRYQTDPDYAKWQRERQRERYRTDPDYAKHQRERQRERQRKRQRERYRTDPVYAERERKRKRESRRERYRTDPAYAERERQRIRQHQRERYQTDPAYVEHRRERQRLRKKQHLQSVSQFS